MFNYSFFFSFFFCCKKKQSEQHKQNFLWSTNLHPVFGLSLSFSVFVLDSLLLLCFIVQWTQITADIGVYGGAALGAPGRAGGGPSLAALGSLGLDRLALPPHLPSSLRHHFLFSQHFPSDNSLNSHSK